ncbi:hypothetical protein [Anaerotignum faecicola]|jgi:hypothetical protein
MYAVLNEANICVAMSSRKDVYDNFVETNLNVLGKRYVDGDWMDVQSEPTLTETEQAILDTAINVDYLVCMKELEI